MAAKNPGKDTEEHLKEEQEEQAVTQADIKTMVQFLKQNTKYINDLPFFPKTIAKAFPALLLTACTAIVDSKEERICRNRKT